ncbi:uncharacterized protein N7515_006727 [Penicillium bovifimosum]|uniref:NmrA-like domain-containing protein n=1 Tax=Penicillium bovifimosum TaxID=126998 RepID=A0A9W9GVL1_9EURO|nr:uncharacterized protein N7515_006727 [Penicillium bovifimosum]KAJ5130688.1 hypothetical protein N7515_006727 [Penicillium bovifimosum]
MTIQQKTITIFGGTGNQGNAVVQSLLAHKDKAFHVRVITRDPTGPVAQELAGLGAELYKADGFNKEQITAAFQESWGAFINVNSDESGEREALDSPNSYDLSISILDAAQAAGTAHVVYSSGANVNRATNGRIHIPGFDCKSYAAEYAQQRGYFTTFTPLLPASFMECWMDESFCKTWGGFPWFGEDGHDKNGVVLSAPPYGGDGRMPWVSLQDDFGDIVHGIFLNPTQYHHRPVQAISGMIRYEDLAKAFTKATGKPVGYQPMESWRDIPQDGSHLRDECQLMFFYMQFCGGRWFAEHVSDDTDAKKCKAAGMEARGLNGKGLACFENWFRRAATQRV